MIKTAIIGMGNMGRKHFQVYSKLKEVEVVAICDIKPEKNDQSFKTLYFEDYKLVASEFNDLDLVSIAVPTDLHFKIASYFIKKKVNVLLEKPITYKYKDGLELIKLAYENRVKFSVGHVERFNPALLKLNDIIESGKLGKITCLKSCRFGPKPENFKQGSIYQDLAIHDVDVINYLLKRTPSNSVKHGVQKGKGYQNSGVVFLDYDEIKATVEVSWELKGKKRTLVVTGSQGIAFLDYLNQSLYLVEGGTLLEIPVIKNDPLTAEIENFVSSIINNLLPKVKPLEALEALKICLN